MLECQHVACVQDNVFHLYHLSLACDHANSFQLARNTVQLCSWSVISFWKYQMIINSLSCGEHKKVVPKLNEKHLFSVAVFVFCSEANMSCVQWKLWITEVTGTHHLAAEYLYHYHIHVVVVVVVVVLSFIWQRRDWMPPCAERESDSGVTNSKAPWQGIEPWTSQLWTLHFTIRLTDSAACPGIISEHPLFVVTIYTDMYMKSTYSREK